MGNCPFVSARVQSGENGFHLSLEDDAGRRSERVVISNETASSIIESWARRDLNFALFPAIPVELSPPQGSVSAVSENPGVLVVERSVPEKKRIWFDLAAETNGSSYFSIGFGGKFSVCAMFGSFCTGITTRFDRDPGITGNSKKYGVKRMNLDLLAQVNYPIEFGRLSLHPGLAFGARWLQTRRANEHANNLIPDIVGDDDDDSDDDDDDDDDEDDEEDEDDDDEDSIEVTAAENAEITTANNVDSNESWAFLLEAHLLGAFKVTESLFIVAGVSADAMPFAGKINALQVDEPLWRFRGSIGVGALF